MAAASAALWLWAQGAEAASSRIALVIGESAYADGALPTTANDAGLVAQVLQAAGFDVVGARDLDQKSVREALRDFLDKANSAGRDMQAFVYFSGRALQYNGDNYLAPIDARILRDTDIPIEAIKLSDFTHALAAAPGLARVVVIDGARPNPYAQQSDQTLAGGLALVDPEPNTVIAFNAAPGSIGVDDSGDYGVYAKTLAGLMRQGGVDIQDVFRETRLQVNQATQGAQLPWSAGKFNAPYFLFERAADAPKVVAKRIPTKKALKQLSAQEAYQVVVERDSLDDYEEFLRDHARSEQARRIEAIVAARREALFWRRAWAQNTPRAYWTYLKYYPQGPHAYDAGRRLDTLAARRAPPPDFDVVEFEDLPPPPPREIIYADRPVYYFGGDDFGPPPPPPPREYIVDADQDDDWRDLPPPPPPSVAGMLPALAVAIPLIIGARAYHDRPRPDGRAPDSAPPPAPPRPMGPPPLPRGVKVIEPPTAVQPTDRPRGPKTAGEVKFAAPPSSAPGRPPAPGVRPVKSPLSSPGASPEPTPVRTALPKPGASPDPTPLPSPTASPGRTPRPKPGASPEPTPTNAQTPLPTPGASPEPSPGRTPRPKPGASPEPTASPASNALPTPTASPEPKPTHSPRPKPGASPDAQPTSAQPPTPGASPEPTKGRRPPPTPGAALKDDAKPDSDTVKPLPKEAPRPMKTLDAKPAGEAPRLAPKPDAPKPKAVEAPKVEAPRPAPPPKAEAPRPAPPPAPKPAPAPKAEAPRPAPPPAPKPEAPRPAQQPASAPAPHPAGAAPACGHPGQPHC